ncbi:sigma-E factor negative regulatory protein [Xanthomonas sp. NCPPB 2654]|uniref:sigma-E factor negative regulatory protein n=1 Tax=unclassified Xanthomonas TaxID=2643310 RepID=UPI0021E0F854|nr:MULTISPECIES: sigma-E factor negative regulatory protein [unclassified Xanthomonas]MDL5368179.1 sigma-E factor negative regulatory protein [Xanthomonas sp. NCPPB 2654]UYC22088.1 sigma-E factor negative regulatory protein [Xanthomonas sp. CFBP 8443]
MIDSTAIPQPEPAPGATPPDKFELHYRQQLSALIDGELPADEARFVLRRLQHDEELSGCHERWQLCGDILRGRVCVPAPADFGARVRQAVAAEAQHADAARAGDAVGSRRAWRWGGSAALAASVAAIALFMARERLPETAPAPATQVASSAAPASAAPAAPTAVAQVPAPTPTPTPADPQGDLGAAVAAAPAVAIAATRRQDAAARRGATRTQQAARSSAARAAEPARAIAAATPPRPAPASPLAPTAAGQVVAQQHAGDPFAHQPAPLQARPWPRSTLAPVASGGAFTASFPRQGAAAAFYPFEPRLPADAASESSPHP